MFNKIPGLLERNFALGYLLPSLVWILASSKLLDQFDSLPLLFRFLQLFDVDTTFLITSVNGLIIVLIGGIFLLAINRELIRFLEGYGKLNPIRLLYFIEKYKFNHIKSEIVKLDSQYLDCYKNGQEFSSRLNQKRAKLMIEIVQNFPDSEEWLLPTSFGNAIRAFEVYPRLMYGVDSIPTWSRLLTVIPVDYRKLIDDSKAIVDLWINLLFITIFIFIEYWIIIYNLRKFELLWIPFLLISFAIISFYRATNAAIIWGDFVKAAFDIYLPELKEKLGFISSSPDETDSKLIWQKFSQAVIYHKPEYMPKRTRED